MLTGNALPVLHDCLAPSFRVSRHVFSTSPYVRVPFLLERRPAPHQCADIQLLVLGSARSTPLQSSGLEVVRCAGRLRPRDSTAYKSFRDLYCPRL